MRKLVTRFAPAPTGMLHIGGARTALFNYIYTQKLGGDFLLRIEDTDDKRSTQNAVNAIIDGLDWLGIKPKEVYYQSDNIARHTACGLELLQEGKAYYCYHSAEELEEIRQYRMKYAKRHQDERKWRVIAEEKGAEYAKEEGEKTGVIPCIRVKAPYKGEIVVNDAVQGKVTFQAEDLEDFVILRGDLSPIYLLASMVDDHDMDITYVIRGVDHLSNTSKQILLYSLFGWDIPDFAHIPLIHSIEGKKLSKREGAVAVAEYKNLGYLPEAVRNYLLHLGWSHGDDEFISDAQAIDWFDIKDVGRSPSRFDIKKLDSFNAYYITHCDNERLFELIKDGILAEANAAELQPEEVRRIKGLMSDLKIRAKTLIELAKNAVFCLSQERNGLQITSKADDILKQYADKIMPLKQILHDIDDFSHDKLYEASNDWAEKLGLKTTQISQILRAKLTSSHISPSIYMIMEVFGKEEVLKRLD